MGNVSDKLVVDVDNLCERVSRTEKGKDFLGKLLENLEIFNDGSDAFKNLEICIKRRILDLEPKDIEGGDQGLTFDGNEIFELAEDDIDDSLKETSSNCIDIGEGENENNGTTRA